MKKLTKLDKIISNITLILILSIVALGLFINYEGTFRVIGIMLAVTYFFFFACHILLCYPTVLMIILLNDYFDIEFKMLSRKSYYIAVIVRFIVFTSIILSVHILWTYLATSLICNDFSLSNYVYQMKQIAG